MPIASSLVKARLIFMEATPSGVGPPVFTLFFHFNPKEYTIDKTSKWKDAGTKANDKCGFREFLSVEPQKLSLDLLLDAEISPTHDVRKDVKLLLRSVQVLPGSLMKNKPAPPVVQFMWGVIRSPLCVVEKVSIKYTMFRPEGIPTRAECKVDLGEVAATLPGQNPTSGSRQLRRAYVVGLDDCLASIANAEYGTPTNWRAIARENGISDPMRLTHGTRLLIPPADEATRAG